MTVVLTEEQRAAVTHPLEPLLIVAGAGTGKTTVMTERIAHLIESGQVEPNHVLGLTFTNKAAAELKKRVQERLQSDADVTVSTYHGFASSLVAGHALELDLHPRTRLLNRPQAWQLLFSVFDEFRFHQRSSLVPGLVVDAALALASRAANYLVPVEDLVSDSDALLAAPQPAITAKQWDTVQKAALGRRELCQVVAAYGARKRERNLIDFDDQIRLAVQLLDDHPEVAQGLRQQHPVVLLDEYQDTNFAQREMLKAIYPPGSAVTAVGDDMQSIYAFRGAHIENILHFDSDFGSKQVPAQRAKLTVNRRSGPQVVTVANLIQKEVDADRTIERELKALETTPATRITAFLAADEQVEADTIAAQVVAAGSPWAQRAVLCRKRRLIPGIVTALEAAGVPVDVVGTSGLLDRPEIVDLLSWLQLLASPASTVGLLRILQGPRYRVSLRDLAALARHARHMAAVAAGGTDDRHIRSDLSDAVADHGSADGLSPQAAERLDRFNDEWRGLAADARRLPVLELCESIVDRTGLWAACDDRARENLLRFLDIAEQFSPVDGDDTSLLAFVEYLLLLDETEEDVPESHVGGDDAVRVMTIHQAKGLEWDSVWVPGLTNNLFPDKRGENALTQTDALPWWVRSDADFDPPETLKWADVDAKLRRRQLDDERRLFYVACTRASRVLSLSAAQWYSPAGNPQKQSAFYDFVAGQSGLVDELFHHEPSDDDPAVAARQRLADVALAPKTEVASSDGPAIDDPSGDAADGRPATSRPVPAALSVSNLVTYARCHRQMYWSVVRPLPTVTSGAASIGTDVHAWIELGGPPVIREPEPEYEANVDGNGAADDEIGAGRGRRGEIVAGLQAAFKASPYADLTPVQVEAPFALAVGGHLVRGRIDAVYRGDDQLELVDFKTGREPAEGDRSAHTQLDLYALAAVDTWGADVAELRTSYCYLRPDGTVKIVSSPWDASRLAQVRADLDAALAALAAGDFSTTVGDWCRGCDFRDGCGPGRTFLGTSAASTDGSQ